MTSAIRFRRSKLPRPFAVTCSKEVFPFFYFFFLLRANTMYPICIPSGSNFKYHSLGMSYSFVQSIPKCTHRCFCLHIQVLSGRKARDVKFAACFSSFFLIRLFYLLFEHLFFFVFQLPIVNYPRIWK